MTLFCVENLKSLKSLISNIENAEYKQKIKCLTNSSIGQHIRHILEFYNCLLDGKISARINYDNRPRNIEIETDKFVSILIINEIIEKLQLINEDCDLKIEINLSDKTRNKSDLNTSLFRELAYCLEHSIHHQALIKVALIEMKLAHKIDKYFGVAPSTIRHRNTLDKKQLQNA